MFGRTCLENCRRIDLEPACDALAYTAQVRCVEVDNPILVALSNANPGRLPDDRSIV